MSAADILIALGVGFVAGAFAGLLGVGGGIVIVPSLVVLLGETQHVAQGTSLMVIIPTALVGTLANTRRGNVDLRLAMTLGLAGAVGAVAGALASVEIDEDILGRAFGALLILTAARLLLAHRSEGRG
jgi:uncharacterized membrane protein YfcA